MESVKPPIYSIRGARKSDNYTIQKISDAAFGKGYYSPDRKKCWEEWYVCEDSGGYVVGYCCIGVPDEDEKAALFQPYKIREIRQSMPIGVIKTLAVDEKNQGAGVGKKLFQFAAEKLSSENIAAIVAPIWDNPGDVGIKKIVKKSGFKFQASLKQYWYEESKVEGFRCRICGKPCYCSCSIYHKNL